jgi:hypothetical protein
MKWQTFSLTLMIHALLVLIFASLAYFVEVLVKASPDPLMCLLIAMGSIIFVAYPVVFGLVHTSPKKTR